MESPVIRVGIADDQTIVRCALRGYLEHVAGIACVGEATHAEEAVQLVRTRELDVLVLDPLMPGSRGLDALRSVRQAAPRVRVVVLSAYPAERYAARAMLAGADAYLEKANGPADRVVREIRAAAAAGRAGTGPEPDDRQAAAGAAAGASLPSRLGAPAWPPQGGEPVDAGGQSILRTVFWLLLVLVSFAMTVPVITLQLLRSYSPWLDQTATVLLGLMLGDNLDHILAFGVLGLSARFAYPQARVSHCAAFLFAVAAVTELVQVWSPGRDPAIEHVVLDVFAAASGFGLAWVAWAALFAKKVPEAR